MKAEIQRSVRLSGKPRIELLRSLQVEWHPDVGKYQKLTSDNEAARELAEGVITLVNEAMMIAKQNAKARGEKF